MRWDDYEIVQVSELIGKTLESVEHNKLDERIHFKTTDGQWYLMLHFDDCCESVGVEDIIGDLADLVGSPVLMAEEATSKDETPEGMAVSGYVESYTWTFYKFATLKGYVTLRWFGQSNGYYSESVSFIRLKPGVKP